MKVIFNKYGGLSTIQDREILVQDSDGVNFLDVYYLDDDGQLVDPTVNLVTAMFRRSDGFVIGEIHLTPLTDANGLKFWRFVFTKESGTLAVAGELEITIRLKVAEYDFGRILYTKQRVGGLVVANVLRAISTPDEYNAYEARIFVLEEELKLIKQQLELIT